MQSSIFMRAGVHTHFQADRGYSYVVKSIHKSDPEFIFSFLGIFIALLSMLLGFLMALGETFRLSIAGSVGPADCYRTNSQNCTN